MNRRRIAAVAAALALTLAACGDADEEGRGDAPVGDKDDGPADITNMPDGFPNFATKCINGAPGFRGFVTTRASGAASTIWIEADPNCTGAANVGG